MVGFLPHKRYSPIGVDLGSRSVKLLQFDSARQRLIEAVRWDLPQEPEQKDELELEKPPAAVEPHREELARLIKTAREGRAFRGRDAVLCLGGGNLHVQNLRVPKGDDQDLQRLVYREAAARLPFAIEQAELRFVEAGEVRQGTGVRREVIVLAVHRAVLERQLQTVIAAGLRPVAVDAEPLALLRCYIHQFRREEDRQQRAMFVHLGATQTLVVIAKGAEILFIKYIDIGGRHLDEAVSQALQIGLAEAAALRRHNGDRRADQQDPEVTRSVGEATRPVVDQLLGELAMCGRYHSVTFRGDPLARLVLSGGEANATLLEALTSNLNLKGELGSPLRAYDATLPGGRPGQWDVVTGLALRQVN